MGRSSAQREAGAPSSRPLAASGTGNVGGPSGGRCRGAPGPGGRDARHWVVGMAVVGGGPAVALYEDAGGQKGRWRGKIGVLGIVNQLTGWVGFMERLLRAERPQRWQARGSTWASQAGSPSYVCASCAVAIVVGRQTAGLQKHWQGEETRQSAGVKTKARMRGRDALEQQLHSVCTSQTPKTSQSLPTCMASSTAYS